jgi:hypothetical protein
MNIRYRSQPLVSLALLAAVILVLCGIGPSVIKKDRFTDNTLASFWKVRTFGNAAVKERNKRLEFSRTGSNGALSAAGVQYKPYGIDWTQPFQIEWKGRLNLPPIIGNQQCFMGTVLYIDGKYPLTMTGIGVGFLRNALGSTFGVVEFTNGTITNFTGTGTLTTATTLVTIDWNPGVDKITAIQNPGPFVPFFGFDASFGDDYGDLPMTIVQGILMIGGNMTVTGSRAYMDNWEASFTRRDFP